MEDVDLYGDLDNFDMSKTIDELETKNSTLTNLIDELKSTLDKMCVEVQESRKVNETLRTNISSLFKTAQLEINRKNQTITELRQELESIKFRRGPKNFSGNKRLLNATEENENAKRMKLMDVEVNKSTDRVNTDTFKSRNNLEEGEIDFDECSNKSENSDSSKKDSEREYDRHKQYDSRKPHFRHDKYRNDRPCRDRPREREYLRDERYHVQRADYFKKHDTRKNERDRREPRHSPGRDRRSPGKEVRCRSKEREFKRSRSNERDRKERPEYHPKHHIDNDRDKRDRTEWKLERIEVKPTVSKILVTSEKRVFDDKSDKSHEYNHNCSNLRIVDDNIIEEINQIQRNTEPDRSVCNILNLAEDNVIKHTTELSQFAPVEISRVKDNIEPEYRILDKNAKKTEENSTKVTDVKKKPAKSGNKRLISKDVYDERNKAKLENKNVEKTEDKSIKEADTAKQSTESNLKKLLTAQISEEGNKIEKTISESEKQIAPKTVDNPPKKNTTPGISHLVSVKMSQEGIKLEKYAPKCETRNKTEKTLQETSVKVTDTIDNPLKSVNKRPVSEEKNKTGKVLPENAEQHANVKKSEDKPTKELNTTKKLTKSTKQQTSNDRNKVEKTQPGPNEGKKTYECTVDNNKMKLKIKKSVNKEHEDTVETKENVVNKAEQMIEEQIKRKPLEKNQEKKKPHQKTDETKVKKVLKDCNQDENAADQEILDDLIIKISEAVESNPKPQAEPAKEQPANENATKVREPDSSAVPSDPNTSTCSSSDVSAATETAPKPVSKARRRRCVVSII